MLVTVEAVEVQAVGAGEMRVILTGFLPSSCATLDEVSSSLAGTRFLVLLRASQPTRTACTPVVTPFEETVLLDVDHLEPGAYTVSAHGVSSSFTLSPSDTPEHGPPEPDMPDEMPEELPAAPGREAAEVRVASIAAEVGDAPPYEVRVHVTGTFPNPCVRIEGARQSRQERHFEVVLEASAPLEGACPDVIAPFEHTLVLDGSGLLPGSYTVSAHGASAAFSWP